MSTATNLPQVVTSQDTVIGLIELYKRVRAIQLKIQNGDIGSGGSGDPDGVFFASGGGAAALVGDDLVYSGGGP